MAYQHLVLTLRWFIDRLPPPIARRLKYALRATGRRVLLRLQAFGRRGSGASELPDPQPIKIERYPLALADLGPDEMRALVASLNEKAAHLGCVIFEGRPGANGVVVVFAGHTERFFMLPVARHVECRTIYIQDLQSGWYQGSSTLPDLETLCQSVLHREIGDQPCLFFGQSSGGYAALAASAGFSNATVLACAPQTFSDTDVKEKIGFIGVRSLSTPRGLLDLRQTLGQATSINTSRIVVIAASEADNPYTAHYWMDYLHALRLFDVPALRLFVVKADSHVIVHGRLAAFARLLKILQNQLQSPMQEKITVLTGFLTEQFS